MPSLLVEVKSSVVPSCSSASSASLTFVSLRSLPASIACTSGVSVAVPLSIVRWPSAPSETLDTVRRAPVSFSTAPPAAVVARPT